MPAIVVLVTASSPKEADRISRVLIEEKLAACVNIIPGISSRYRWQGKVETSEEVLLIVKTLRGRFSTLERRVRSIHSYSVPEIIALPVVKGSQPYLTWIQKSISR